MDSASAPHAMDRPAGPRRYWQIPTFLAGLAAVYAAYVYSPARTIGPNLATAGELADLRSALEQKTVDAAAIEPILRNLAAANPVDTQANYAIGSGYMALADLAPSANADYWQAAAKAFAKCDLTKLADPNDSAKFIFRNAMAQAATHTGVPGEILQFLVAPPPGEQRAERSRLIAETAMRLSRRTVSWQRNTTPNTSVDRIEARPPRRQSTSSNWRNSTWRIARTRRPGPG